jgi:hypothetical protein
VKERESFIPLFRPSTELPSAQPSAFFNPFGFGFGMPDVCALWSKQGSVRCMSETNEHLFLSVGVTFYNLMNQINSRGFQNVKIYYSKANTKKAIIILPLFSKKNTKKKYFYATGLIDNCSPHLKAGCRNAVAVLATDYIKKHGSWI